MADRAASSQITTPARRYGLAMSPVATAELIVYLDRLLQPAEFDDYGPNGLQVPGRDEVATVVTGVSAGSELFDRAAAERADLVLVHHGLLWKGPPRPLDRAAKRRLQLLFDADIALAAYHLPLDAHLEHGNNALLAAAIGAAVSGSVRRNRRPGRLRVADLGHGAARPRSDRLRRPRAARDPRWP